MPLVLLAVAGLMAGACSTTAIGPADEAQSRGVASPQGSAPAAVTPAEDGEGGSGVPSVPFPTSFTPGAPGASSTTAKAVGSATDGPTQAGFTDIRTVDFENGFTYQNAAYDDATAVVVDGVFEHGELGDDGYFWFAVNDVQYGDLNNDGVEEAVVVTGHSGGGSGFFQSVRAFALVDGVVTDVGVIPFGDRAFGGVAEITIEAGIISVLMFFDGEGSCCPTEATVVRLVLGEQFLVEADMGVILTHISLSQFEEQRLVKFLPNTSGAYASMWGDDLDSSFSLEAGPGQVLTVEVLSGPTPSTVAIVDTSTGERVGSGASAVLPSDAIYEVDIGFDEMRTETTTLLVQIDGEPETISWVPMTEQVVVTNEPFVHSSLIWPVFSSTTADRSSLGRANAALAAFVVGVDDLWIEDVTEFTTPQDDSTFELTYEVTYAADDLVAVRLSNYEYVCCRAHPNYGPLAAVLDLDRGRLLAADDILDFGRSAEIGALWLAALEAEGVLPPELLTSLDPTMVTRASVGLVPGGIELGTGRGVLFGGNPGTTVVLSFEELGDLLQPSLRDRLAGTES